MDEHVIGRVLEGITYVHSHHLSSAIIECVKSIIESTE